MVNFTCGAQLIAAVVAVVFAFVIVAGIAQWFLRRRA
jgi:hypothetical protein